MSYLLRVLLPDRPGMLGAVASALGQAGADILGVDIVERSAGVAVDDLIVDLPPGKLADTLITAAVSVPGVTVESIQRYYAGAGEAHRELELLEALATSPERAAELLVSGAPRIFRAGWAVVVRYDERGPLVEAASPAAPDLAEVDLPWLPLARAQVLDPTARWVPPDWGALGTELAAAPLGDPDRAMLVGRPGGPAWRPAELLRLAHLAGIAVTVAAQSVTPPQRTRR
ncbi:MAG TPA: ACT domain-containing protein [Mycobacteriales bacterium]